MVEFETEDIIPITYGFTSHCLNILSKNIIIDFIIANAVKMQKFFRNHYMSESLLREYADSLGRSFYP